MNLEQENKERKIALCYKREAITDHNFKNHGQLTSKSKYHVTYVRRTYFENASETQYFKFNTKNRGLTI